LTNESARKQFRKEALALSRLNHPNIATIYDFDTQERVDFLAMEYIPGTILSEMLSAGPLPEKEILRLGIQLAEGLAAAHEHGVVHRDLKPGNLRLTSDGRLKILDFGLAKLRQPAAETAATQGTLESRAITGTLAYMAPEQLCGETVDARTDIHAAGMVLYEMATGQRPFAEVESALLIGAILHRPPRPPATLNPQMSPELARIIGKCLEKEPENRYQSAKELSIDLQRLQRDFGVPAILADRGVEPGRATATKEAGPLPSAKSKWIRWAAATGVALLVIGLAVYGWLFYSRKAHALTEKDTIVLADFTNTTGDPVFDGTLRRGLAVQLEQSPFLSLISDRRIQETLRLMKRPPDARLVPEIARELCQRTGSVAVLEGSIGQVGAQYSLVLRAVNCSSGDSLVSTEAQASDKNHILDALGKAATEIRSNLGESLSTVEKFDTPLRQATTGSLEALQAYSLGRDAMGRTDNAAAKLFFQRAIRLDPNFAMAYASLGNAYGNLGETSLAAENTKKAYELRERVSEREKLYIESHYYGIVSGDLEKARQAYELWAQTYPRDVTPLNNLGVMYIELGQYEKALFEYREALRMQVDAMFYANLAICYAYVNRLEEAQATAREAQEKHLDTAALRANLYLVAFLQNDSAGMAQQVTWAAGKPGVEDVLLAYESSTAAYSGRLRKAREFSRSAVASAERAQETEVAATYHARAALREALFGNPAEARQRAATALNLSRGRDAQFLAALALAFAGDAARAQALANDFAKRFPEDTWVQYSYLPAIRAQLALIHNGSSKAIETLRAAVPYDLAYGGQLYPVYVRGQAYLAARQGQEAAAEFQTILEHSGVVLSEPIGALARLGLGRAYALQAQSARGAEAEAARAKSRTAYQDFFALWKDADPDIPVLLAARNEYANLK
jgi:tetratricopeptide (TPR) repeat protein/tRNA A-37 threonylcarbamoyl transferase component Bud32